MISLIFLAVALQAGSQVPPPAPTAVAVPTLQMSEIDRCKPQTINEAIRCIKSSLDETIVRDIGQSAGDGYRPSFERLITSKWGLDNPNSPIARELASKKVYRPDWAAGILIADMTARENSQRFDYNALAKRVAQTPAATAPAPVKAAIVPGPLPLERCKTAADPADMTITGCVQNADGTINRTFIRPVAPGVAPSLAPGSLPQGIPAGSVAVELDRCKSSAPLPVGVMLKACYKLPDGRFARHAVRDPNAPKN